MDRLRNQEKKTEAGSLNKYFFKRCIRCEIFILTFETVWCSLQPRPLRVVYKREKKHVAEISIRI